jgi:hypothetical protein
VAHTIWVALIQSRSLRLSGVKTHPDYPASRRFLSTTSRAVCDYSSAPVGEKFHSTGQTWDAVFAGMKVT